MLSTLLGILTLFSGYVLVLRVDSLMEAFGRFFMAVVLVMAGTYRLFSAGSIALLKCLRKNPHYYYKPNPFVAVSQLMYRMKQNAVGLANISILSTAVLVTLSTTLALYVGAEDALRVRYPKDVAVTLYGPSPSANKEIRKPFSSILQGTIYKQKIS